MKHEKIYKIKELETPIIGLFRGENYNYVLEATQDGVTKEDDFFKFETLVEAQAKCRELNKKIYLSYFDEEEIEEFYNSIDFQPLYDKINKTIGLQLTYTNKLRKTRDGYHVDIESNEDIANMFLIIKAAWKEFKVTDFGSQICPNEETRDLKFWCTINYSYRHQDGGTNGAHILNATYTMENGWEMMSEIERQEYYNKRKVDFEY